MIRQDKIKELNRSRLDADMEAILEKPLMIITAPSGYGKTMLVRAFFSRHTEIRTIWMSLGQDAVDDVWIWQKICRQFQESPVYEKIRDMGFPESPRELESFVEVIKDVAVYPICLIADDYHVSNSVWINGLLERLTYKSIENLHILIISRTYPDMPYEELMLKGYCAVIDQQLLTLSREEVEEIFDSNGVGLSEDLMDRIYRYTDGWISAVYLILYDYKRTGRLRLSVGVMHLMKTAIFDKLPGDIRRLLMCMSLFDSFTVEEASNVVRQEIKEKALDEVSEQFGFLQYDIVSGRYEMHALLKQTAAAQLAKSEEDVKELYRRNAQWNRRNGNYIYAILYYKKAGEIEEIFQLLEEQDKKAIFEEAPAMIEDFFNEVDEETSLRHPMEYLSYIYFLFIKGNFEEGRRRFERAKTWYEQKCREWSGYDRLRGEIYIVEALLEYDNLEKVNAYLRESYRLLGNSTSRIFHNAILTYGTPQTLILYHKQAGNLRKTVELEKEYSRLFMRLFNGVDGNWDDLFDAEYSFSIGQLEEAARLSLLVVEKAKFRKQICVMLSGYNILLRRAVAEGNRAAFDQYMEEMDAAMEGVGRPMLAIDYDLARGYAYCCAGQPDKTAQWLQDFNLEECNHVVRSTRNGCIVHGVWLREKKQWALLDAVAEQMLVPYERETYLYVVLYAYIYKAEAVYHLIGLQSAAEILLKGIQLAQPDGIRFPFMENADEILPLLEHMAPESPFAAELIPCCKQYEKGSFLIRGGKKQDILTVRERELMGYVEAGLRNSDISKQMNIALVTVEKNLTAIYRKLNVSNRLAAIARLKEYLSES